jgi:hypothetical protein
MVSPSEAWVIKEEINDNGLFGRSNSNAEREEVSNANKQMTWKVTRV